MNETQSAKNVKKIFPNIKLPSTEKKSPIFKAPTSITPNQEFKGINQESKAPKGGHPHPSTPQHPYPPLTTSNGTKLQRILNLLPEIMHPEVMEKYSQIPEEILRKLIPSEIITFLTVSSKHPTQGQVNRLELTKKLEESNKYLLTLTKAMERLTSDLTVGKKIITLLQEINPPHLSKKFRKKD